MTTLEREIAVHRFGVGRMVHFKQHSRYSNNIAAVDYKVLGQLPARDGELQYLVKGNREPYNRVINESEVEGTEGWGI